MSLVDEGFICPYCLVGFATSGKLQSHFVEMHSGSEAGVSWEGDGDVVGATAGYEQLGDEDNRESVDGLLGHQFVLRRMQKPSSCSACEEIIWQDGIACQSCPVVIHGDGCRGQLTVTCTTTSSDKPQVIQQNGVQRSAGPQQPAKGPFALVRRQIAKGRDRFVNEEFDLDLTYITERIIAMSFPATGVQSAYRNSLKDVAKMLRTKHQESYMIFNLSERSYDISWFNNQVLDFGWPDHLAPSLERLSTVCRSMKSWLDSDPQHVVVVHCKGGKGRTGCVIAAFMNYSEICQSAEAALDRFAMKRFYDSKCVGVTQPSQRKYVHYFSDLLAGKISLKTPPVVLNHVIIHGVPNCDGKGGCRLFLKIYVNMKLEHTSGLYVSSGDDERIKISLHGRGLNLQGEVLLKCFHKKTHGGVDSVFRCQLHTAIVQHTLRLVLKKEDLDDAFRDKKFPETAKVEMLFENDREKGYSAKEDVDLRSSLLETNGAAAPAEPAKHESLSKRDSYASFEGGYDSGVPDKVPDLIRFSPTSPPLLPPSEKTASPRVRDATRQQRTRIESTDSFHMDPEAIERVAMPGSDDVYTVVNKSAPGIKMTSQAPRQDPSPPPKRGREGRVVDPPYVNQAAIPSNAPPTERPTVYRKSVKAPTSQPPAQRFSKPSQHPPAPRTHVSPHPSLPLTDVDYDEVPDDDEVDGEGQDTLVNCKGQQQNSQSNAKPSRTSKAQLAAGHNKKAYDEILIDQQMKLQPVTPRHSGHDSDPGWCKFKFQTLPSNRGDSGQRSSSSSNPTLGSNSGEMYSNLGDLFVGGAFVGESQRRHSFTEGDERIVIRGTCTRDSIIQVAGGEVADYNNMDALSLSEEERRRLASVSGQEEALYTNPDKVVAALNLEVKSDKRGSGGGYYNLAMPSLEPGSAVPMPRSGGVVPPPSSGATIQDEDYMNELPEGMFHTYSNHKELLEQLQAGNSPIPEPVLQRVASAAMQGGENSKWTALLKSFISKAPFLKRTSSGIHSRTITDTDRQKTLLPFALTGNAQAGRDYEAFFKASAWGGAEPSPRPNKPEKPEKPEKPDRPDKPDKPDVKPDMRQSERAERLSGRPERPRRPDVARHRPTDIHVGDGSDEKSRQRPVKVFPPETTPTAQDRTPPPAARVPSPVQISHAPQLPRRRPLPSHTALEAKLSIPTPHSTPAPLGGHPVKATSPSASPRGHRRVAAAKSMDQPSDSSERPGRAGGRARNRHAPPKPPPYIPQVMERNPRVPSESKVRSLMPYWYRPNITREEAIGLVRQMDSGAFIVRDSQTVAGGYALTIKVTEAIVRQRKKLAEGTKVTEDMCVTHFLIQPDPEGVKLQGWNERAFKSLPEFIAHHTVDKLCLPCTLVLPKSGKGGRGRGGGGGLGGEGGRGRGGGGDGGRVKGGGGDGGDMGAAPQVRRRPVTMQEALKTGAACDLVYLGSVDVTGPGSEVVLGQTVQQRKSLDISVSVVTFKASKEGITISDNVSGLYIKRQYPISSLTYCGADPNDTRWDFPQLQHLGESIPITNAPCFGVFHRLPDGGGHSCLLFAQYLSSQPVSSILSYLRQVTKQRQH